MTAPSAADPAPEREPESGAYWDSIGHVAIKLSREIHTLDAGQLADEIETVCRRQPRFTAHLVEALAALADPDAGSEREQITRLRALRALRRGPGTAVLP